MQALAPKPKPASVQPLTSTARDRTILVRSSVEPHRIVYGQAMVSGPMVAAFSTGSENEFLHLVIPLAGHQVKEIGDVYFNDVLSTDARFSGLQRVNKHLGSEEQAADTDLDAELTAWTSAHRLRGLAYIYVRLKWDQNVWVTGIPNIKAVVKGKKLWDPRAATVAITSSSVANPTLITTGSAHGLAVGDQVYITGHAGATPKIDGEYEVLSTPLTTTFTIRVNVTVGGSGGTMSKMAWTPNASLCQLDYLAGPLGIVAPSDKVHAASWIAAANICEEQVTLADDPDPFVADPATEQLTITNPTVPLALGDIVRLTTTGTLPAGLALATNYYVIPVRKTLTTYVFQLATTFANAILATAINITDAGTGTHTVTRKSQPRYLADGVSFADQRPLDAMEDLLTASAGTMVYQQGTYRGYAGAYATPAITLDNDDLRGELRVQTKRSRQEVFNAVRGVFVDQLDFWQPKDFPPVTNSTYETQDGSRRLFKDVELSFTTDIVRAQRLAKIALERSRQDIIVHFPATLAGLELASWDTIMLTNSQLGWASKVFRVLSWTLAQDGGVDLTLQEEASTAYDWTAGQETIVDPAPNTTLPNPFTVGTPTGLTLASGQANLFIANDGTVHHRIRVTWTMPTDQYVLSGGSVEIQFKKSAVSDWEIAAGVPGNQNFQFISPVEPGVSYDVRIRFVNQARVKSAFTSTATHVVVGKTNAPSDVTSFSASQNGNVVNFRWAQVADDDIAGYEIRFGERGNSSWASATPVTKVTRGTAVTNAMIPSGDWTFYIKAVDTTGNESQNADSSDAVITATFSVVLQRQQAHDWLGTKTNCVKHQITRDNGLFQGTIVPESTVLADAAGFEIFDNYVYSPVSSATYEAPEQDIGFDDTVRVWASINAALGPGVVVGVADPDYQIDYKLAAGAYDGFEVWSIGNVPARFIKQRFVLTTSVGLAKATGFLPTIDKDEVPQGARGVVVASGGTTIVFPKPYHNIPRVQVTPDAASALIATKKSVTTAQFVAQVFNTTPTDVGGVIDWEAVGV
jgi:hypothetical protein